MSNHRGFQTRQLPAFFIKPIRHLPAEIWCHSQSFFFVRLLGKWHPLPGISTLLMKAWANLLGGQLISKWSAPNKDTSLQTESFAKQCFPKINLSKYGIKKYSNRMSSFYKMYNETAVRAIHGEKWKHHISIHMKRFPSKTKLRRSNQNFSSRQNFQRFLPHIKIQKDIGNFLRRSRVNPFLRNFMHDTGFRIIIASFDDTNFKCWALWILETLFCILYCMADFDFPVMRPWNREFLVK